MTALKNCPSCWRPIKFEEKYARVIACGYCNSILEFGSWELNKIWEQSEFIEFPSIFIVWKEVEWKGKKVYVKWQLRYEYDWGFFDTFFVTIENKKYYIHEDDGKIILLQEGQWQDSNMTLLDKSVWETINIEWNEVFIQETGLFKLVSMKWFVNSDLIPWKEYEYLDGVMDGRMVYFEKEIWENKVRMAQEIKS